MKKYTYLRRISTHTHTHLRRISTHTHLRRISTHTHTPDGEVHAHTYQKETDAHTEKQLEKEEKRKRRMVFVSEGHLHSPSAFIFLPFFLSPLVLYLFIYENKEERKEECGREMEVIG